MRMIMATKQKKKKKETQSSIDYWIWSHSWERSDVSWLKRNFEVEIQSLRSIIKVKHFAASNWKDRHDYSHGGKQLNGWKSRNPPGNAVISIFISFSFSCFISSFSSASILVNFTVSFVLIFTVRPLLTSFLKLLSSAPCVSCDSNRIKNRLDMKVTEDVTQVCYVCYECIAMYGHVQEVTSIYS